MKRRLPLLLALIAAPAWAQGNRVQLNIALPPPPASSGLAEAEGPTIWVQHTLADSSTRVRMRSGFTARLHFRLELWRKSRWFDDPAGVDEWDVLASYEPATQLYKVVRQHGKVREDFGTFGDVSLAEAQIDQPFKAGLHPERGGRYYFNVALDVESLSLSDLDAALGWLRGDVHPAVQGKSNPLNALQRGIELLLQRVVGGGARHYEVTSGLLDVP